MPDSAKPDLPNPHDRFFKEVFSRPEIAADFLANYLPANVTGVLDLADPQLVKGSFVDTELRHHFSDLLYRVRLRTGPDAFVYLLFEHKSAPDGRVAFQLLRYLVRIWEPMARRKTARLPPIFPLVLYHGRTKWNVATNFAATIDCRDAEALKRYLPEFEYHVCDLTEYEAGEIQGAIVLRVALLAMKYVFAGTQRAKISEILRLLARLMSEQVDALEYIRMVLIYFSAASKGLTSKDFRAAVKATLPEQEGWIMSTLAETWMKKGYKQGVQEGITQGMQKEAVALTIRLLERRLGRVSARNQERVRALKVEQLEELGVALLDFEAQKDLAAWLASQG